MVAAALMVLVGGQSSVWLTIPATVIIGREILISALREWMARRGQSDAVAVSYLGKVKTFMQMLAIFCMLCSPNWPRPFVLACLFPGRCSLSLYGVGVVLLYVSAALAVSSMLDYVNVALKSFNDSDLS